ncbi:cuticle protein 16.8 [Trichonephila clavata]|uniref:Cuticle protein 16.8 n=1 Tax=Trichonephila clavata TaxID=2740835 RepID=A0A8X6KKS2_TRICU|nr:cuticle protein 16.8 [Trichonephila clavata]
MISMLFAIFLIISVLSAASAVPIPYESTTDPNLLNEVPSPYDFGFEFGDDQGMVQYRRESSNVNGEIKGSYGYTDSNGLYRNVEYTAGADGYKAVIRSNEPGLSNQNTADATFFVEPPPPEVLLEPISPEPEVFIPEI